MKNPMNCEGCSAIGLLLARVPVGVVLLLAGYGKFHQEGGVAAFVDHGSSLARQYMPAQLANLYLTAIPFAEMILGGLLVVGLLTRVSGLLAALMLISFGIATGGVRGFFNPEYTLSPQLFLAPFTYGVLALVAFFAGPGRISLDGLLFRGRRAVRVRD